MFRIERAGNPLDQLVAGTGTAYVQQQLQQQKEQREMSSIGEGLSKLNEESSPLEWYRTINSMKGVSPESKEQLFKMAENTVQTSSKRQKETENLKLEDEGYNTIKGQFGQNAADLWKATTVGGRTDLQKTMLDAKIRGENVEELLSGVKVPENVSPEVADATIETALTGEPVFPKMSPFSGLKPNEVPAYRKVLRGENLPLFNAAKDHAHTAENLDTSYGILEDINESGELPSGLGRIIINPTTGQPYGVAALFGKVNAPTQRWIKTINDFTTQAKDSFGARVTNFDLQQFLARLPGLLNSPEGRRVIIKQMQIIGKLNSSYDKALKKVYGHYGLDKITPEDADALAESTVTGEKESLKQELRSLGQESDRLHDQSLKTEEEFPDAASNKGRRIVDDESGSMYESDGKTWREVNG